MITKLFEMCWARVTELQQKHIWYDLCWTEPTFDNTFLSSTPYLSNNANKKAYRCADHKCIYYWTRGFACIFGMVYLKMAEGGRTVLTSWSGRKPVQITGDQGSGRRAGAQMIGSALNLNHRTVHDILTEEFDVVCTVHHIAMCRWPTRCTILINNFLFHRFYLLALHVSKELLINHQDHCIIYCITQYIRLIVQASLAASS